MANQAKLAADILEAVGGKGNVAAVTHCMTRIRFNLKDESVATDEKLKAIAGVIGVVRAAGQVQVVVGNGVDKVYDELCRIEGMKDLAEVLREDTGDAPKEKLTAGKVVNNIMAALSGCITPILPVFIAAGIFKMIAVLLGPDNFGLLAETNDFYRLCNIVGSAGYYFLPFFTAYSAAKKFGCNPIMTLLYAGILLHPDMLAIVTESESFTVYGIPMPLVSYVQAVIPIILIVWIMSYVEKWLKKVIPDMLRTIGIPVLTMAIMLPLGLCLLGPVCNIIMGFVADGIVWLTGHVGILAMVIVGALWSLVIVFGMHVPVLTALLPVWMEIGFDAVVSPAAIAAAIASIGVELGYALRADGKENKSLGWSCFVANVTANISEPYVYGIYLRDRKAFTWHLIGGAAGALVMGILGAKIYIFSGVGFPWLNFLRFGEDAVKGGIGMIVAFVVSLAFSLVFGFEKAKKEE